MFKPNLILLRDDIIWDRGKEIFKRKGVSSFKENPDEKIESVLKLNPPQHKINPPISEQTDHQPQS